MELQICLLLLLLPSLLAGTTGEKECCSSHCTSVFCKSSCAREGDACRVGSSKCLGKVEKEKVDCSKKTEDGESCCVFSNTGALCECVQRRCHDDFHPGQVPKACVAKQASPQWPVLLSAFLVLLAFLAGITWWMKRKRRLKEQRRKSEFSRPPSSGEGEACLSMEVKSEDLKEKERTT